MLIIPVLLIIVSLLTAFIIIARKFPYLKKLTPEAGQHFSSTWAWDFVPEVRERYQRIDWTAHKNFWLKEGEKFLRRIRLAFLKIDSATHALIKKLSVSRLEEVSGEGLKEEAAKPSEITSPAVPVIAPKDHAELKREEQALIIAVAKDPKNPELYRQLAAVYMELGNPEDAAESLRTVVQLDPEDKTSEQRLAELEKIASSNF